MEQVATINGVKVFSDKQVHTIANTKITFVDGSWCDVNSGKIVNEGGGYIHFDDPNVGKTTNTINEKKSFDAKSLSLKGISGSVFVESHSGDNILVDITSTKEILKNIVCAVEGDVLVVEDTRLSTNTKNSSITITNGSISFGGGISGMQIFSSGKNQTIISSSAKVNYEIRIKVPKHLPIKAHCSNGVIEVENVEGDIDAVAQAGVITLGKTLNAVFSVQGNGDIVAKSVEGTLVATVQGNGDIKVADGKVTKLTAVLQGNGDIEFKGEAVDATLSVMGNGDIKVHSVLNKPIKNIMGNGDIKIKVKNWK